MRRKLWLASLAGGVCGAMAIQGALWAQEPAPSSRIGVPRWFGNFFLTAQAPAQPPAQPPVPPTGIQPPALPPAIPPAPVSPVTPPTTPAADANPFADFAGIARGLSGSFVAPQTAGESGNTAQGAGGQGVLSTSQQNQVASTPSTGVVSGAEATTRSTSDAGDLLGKSFGSIGVEIQRRNPIVSEPRIRGFHVGQVVTTADGAFWTPARVDLDTIVSKLDSANIANILVLKGPYTVRQGAGFTFLDIETLSSPRYETFEVHGATSGTYKSNGQGLNGRQAIWGGGSDYGFRLSYDLMTANDYRTGGPGLLMPSSYNSQNFSFNFGFDITEDSRLEFRALHLSQRNIEFPGIVTDLNAAITDGYTLRYIAENQEYFDRMTFDAWYNNTRFNGDSLRAGKARQIPELNDFAAGLPLGFQAKYFIETNGENHTWGFREATTWGRDDMMQVTAGFDFTYESTAINEFDTFAISTQNFPLPRSYQTDPGLFADILVPIGEQFSVKSGVRADINQAQIQQPLSFPTTSGQVNQNDFLLGILGPNALDTQNFFLYAGYITGEYELNNEVTVNLGYGYAQRAPTMTEMFAAGMFLGVLQPGLTFVRGNPNLEQEQLHQIDFGMRANYEYVRAGGNLFYAHVFDYITYQRFSRGDLGVFNGYNYINTAQAQLYGCEGFTELDLLDWLTGFGTLAYTRGIDITRNEALPSIFPLDTRVGLRVHEPGTQPKWAVEGTARMVAAQNQVAYLLGDPTTGGTNELPTAGFTVFDVRGYYAITKNTLLTAGIENIADRFYREHLDYRSGGGVFQPGLNVYVGARVSY